MSLFETFIRDENGNRVGQIEDYSNLTFVRRFNAVGTWSLASTPESLSMLTKKGGIEVYRNGEPHFSGYVRRFHNENGLELVVSGKNDLMVVEKQLAYPVPGGAPFSTDYDVRTGIAETIIKQFVDVNIGPNAIPARRVPGLSIETDYGRGGTVTGRARFDKLLELINSLSINGGIGFRIRNLVFETFIPEDKTGTIVFSKELGTLGDFASDIEAGQANYIVCGGSGEGSARTFVEGSNSESVLDWGRAEFFLDKGNTSSAIELNAAILEELTKQKEKITITFSPMGTENMRPVDDYDVGDWVTYIEDGVSTTHQVREMKTTVSSTDGEDITLAIGTDGASSDLGTYSKIYSRVRDIDQRLNAQERR
ncbi:MAG TPA: hypothetical protein DIW44_12550 [Anaerolineaceae bacterium]|nr:hypothetical protein [Anaerolineaceae bacterium]